eukprot:1156284-Pelagomonas_calceolata.AAC.1
MAQRVGQADIFLFKQQAHVTLCGQPGPLNSLLRLPSSKLRERIRPLTLCMRMGSSDPFAPMRDIVCCLLQTVTLFMRTGSADLFAPVRDDPSMLPGGLAVGRRASFGVNTMAGLGDRMLLEMQALKLRLKLEAC